MSLLYVGTGPKDAKSKRFLRDRLKDHIGQDSTRSTLRRSLGCLLAECLGLEFEVARTSRRKRSGSTVYHFGLGAGESLLSDWIEKNARISWIKHDRPWELEGDLIRKLVLPLNLQDNDRHPFAKTIGDLRQKHFDKALQKRKRPGANVATAGRGVGTSPDNLKAYLSRLSAGAIEDPEELTSLLAKCWEELDGYNDGGMESYKLDGRMEAVEWNPPFLAFNIARHGSTVMSSVYAELQHWSVNVDSGTARYEPAGRRVVGRKSERLDVQPIAKEIAHLFIEGKDDVRLKWKDSETVQVRVGAIIPDEGPKQTVASRRKRFWAALEAQLQPHGWVKASQGRCGIFTRRQSNEKDR
jgi:hypothetical protein